MLLRKIYTIILTTTLVNISVLGICSCDHSLVKGSTPNLNSSNQTELLQTQISQRDMKIIEQLVEIAQRNSPQVRETRAAMGLSAFTDVISIEIAPYLSKQEYISSTPSSENENGLSATFTIDPIKLINTFKRQPIATARWQEAKNQKRVTVVQYYLAYLQARQAVRIATHKLKKFTTTATTKASANTNHLDNPEYLAAATEMLAANTRERITLEELAASVGLSPEQAIAIVDGES
jgi:hypothetical protein